MHLQPYNNGQALSRVEVSLTVGQPPSAVQSGTIYYSGSGGNANDLYRFAVEVDASSLSTGMHDWAMTITQRYGDQSTLSNTYYGQKDIVNLTADEFGKGWWPRSLDRLVEQAQGAAMVRASGDITFYCSDGDGSYLPENADYYGTQVVGASGGYLLWERDGTAAWFNAAGLPTWYLDPANRATNYYYIDGDNDSVEDELYEVVDPDGRTMTYAYSGGRVSQITDFAGLTYTLGYDGSGRLTSITQPDPDGEGELEAPVTQFAYNAANRLTSVTDAEDQTTTIAYDFAGTLHTITGPDSGVQTLSAVQVQALVDLSQTGYDGDHLASLKLTADSVEGTWLDPYEQPTTFQVDRLGQRTTWTDPLNQTSTVERTAAGWATTVTDPLQRVTTCEYDTLGRMTYITDPLGHVTHYFYDSAGRTTEVVSAEGTADESTVQYAYDSAGCMTSMTDPMGAVTTYDYDSSGHVVTVTGPDPDGEGELHLGGHGVHVHPGPRGPGRPAGGPRGHGHRSDGRRHRVHLHPVSAGRRRPARRPRRHHDRRLGWRHLL